MRNKIKKIENYKFEAKPYVKLPETVNSI